jgi:hypothetical protein
MMCLFADLSLYRGTRRQPLHRSSNQSQVHTHPAARPWPAPISCANARTFAIFIAIAAATPWPRSCRGVANLSLRASSRFKNLMRPTGEAFEPVSGDFVCRLLKDRCSSSANYHRSCAAAAQSLFAPGFQAMQPARVDSVEGNLVVSAPHSKWFFCLQRRSALFTGSKYDMVMARRSRSTRAEFRPNRRARPRLSIPLW